MLAPVLSEKEEEGEKYTHTHTHNCYRVVGVHKPNRKNK
jgi:hypothetical protein